MASGGVSDIAHGECTCYRSVRLSESSRNVLPMCYPSAFLFLGCFIMGCESLRSHYITPNAVHICIAELETVLKHGRCADLLLPSALFAKAIQIKSNKSKISRRCVLFSQGFIDLSSTSANRSHTHTLASARTIRS